MRVRQHVNPLALRYLEPRAEPIAVPTGMARGCRVEVELGCADAKFSFELARRHPDRFVVGLDIRDKVIEANRRQAATSGVGNLAFGYVNLNVDLHRVFGPASVDRFHLLFPDPWFKSKHHKRRVVDPEVLAVMAGQLRPGGELHVASDVFEIAMTAMAEIEDPRVEGLGLRNLAGPWSFWRGNPFGAASRREDTTLRRAERVWRMRYVLSGSTAGSESASSSVSQFS